MIINLPNNVKKKIRHYIPHKKCIHCQKKILTHDKILYCCQKCYLFNINKQIIKNGILRKLSLYRRDSLTNKITIIWCIFVWCYLLYIQPLSFCIFWLLFFLSYFFCMYLFVRSQ